MTSWRSEFRALLKLSLPVVTVQVGLMTMGLVDTMMAGHVSRAAIAAVALGNLYVFGLSAFGLGTLLALDPLVAQAVGARDSVAISRALQRGLVLAAALTLPVCILLLFAGPALELLGQPPDAVPLAASYAAWSIPGILPLLAFVVLRQSLQAMHRTRSIVLTIVGANFANAFLDWVLIFGGLGFPRMEVAGAGLATSICRWLMALGLLAAAWPDLRAFALPLRREALAPGPLARMFRLGAPIGVQYQLEIGAFGVVMLFMGWIGTAQEATLNVAGHQVALQLAAFSFMVPLGVSTAAAVLVGNAIGRGDVTGVKRASATALVVGTGVMVLSGVVFTLVPHELAGVFTPDRATVAVAALLIPIAGIFQVFDGLQVVAIGVLRGVGDTRAPMLVNVIGFWCFGVPLSYWLGITRGWGPEGLWWGLVGGLAAVSAILVARVRHRLGGDLRRIVIDTHAA